MRRRATIGFAVVVASCALAVAGCGGDDESASATDVDQWATEFCTAVGTWTDAVQTAGDELKASPSSDALKEAVDSVSSATDTFVEDVRGLGAPDTPSGEEVRSSLQALGDTLETEKADIEQAVEDMSGLTGLTSAVSTIGTSLTAMGSAFQTALDSIESADAGDELKTALESSDACSDLTS